MKNHQNKKLIPNKKSFILYCDTYEAVKGLTQKGKGDLLDAIFLYAQKQPLPKMSKVAKMAFGFIKQTMDRDFKKWENIVERNRKNIRHRYLPKSTKSTSGRTGLPKRLDSVSVNDSDSVNENISKKKRVRTYKSTETNKKYTLDQTAIAILGTFNREMNTKFKSVKPILSGLEFWLDTYAPNEIEKAIIQIPFHPFWKDKMTPTMLFRRRNPRGESVDYLGELINSRRKKWNQ